MSEVPDENEVDPQDDRRESEAAFEGGDEFPSSGFLSVYDRLRERVLGAIERRGGRLSEGAVRALLLVPDVFMLLVRLALDGEVPKATRALIGGALAYFILPTDLLPEAFVGGIGYLDDLVLAVAVLGQAFGDELEPWARKHWSGSEDLRVVLRDISHAGRALLGENLYQRVKNLLARRGVRVEETPSGARPNRAN
jgi:uncharacterized membrane protein YkvA (DUF1232 family)